MKKNENNFKFDKYSLNKASDILGHKLVDEIKFLINSETKNLKKDYSTIDFQKNLFKETFASRALSYRVFNDKITKKILKKINYFLKKNIFNKSKNKFIIDPLIYIRNISPKHDNIKNYEKARYYTQPHYDKSFQNKSFYSVWVPVEDTSKNTGTLCYFNISKKLKNKKFPREKKNKYNFGNYFKNPYAVDKFLKNSEIEVYTKKGDCIFFNNYCLHGATKPINKNRFSINFHMYDSSAIRFKNKFEKEKFQLSSMSMDLLNFLNLVSIGDNFGAKRILKKNKIKNFEKIAKKFKIDIDFKNFKIKKIQNFYQKRLKKLNFLKNLNKNVYFKHEPRFLIEKNFI